ncbi:hypothetical protein [Arthrobacter ramosus]|uniref:Polysaccharide biosynthesis protein n=1 Tax=Arthrobacter ramosus TaxID=1672 RepID=A0ABV5XV05_ARTRM|nr:hypothetical protein [Arthrobacter ramosus]
MSTNAPKRSGVSGAASYVTGILLSTGSTYLLFVCFSFNSPPAAVGGFALWASCVAVILQFIDGVSAQRIAQVRSELASYAEDVSRGVNYTNRGRLLILLIVAVPIGAIAFNFSPSLGLGLFTILVGQGAYSFCLSARIFDPTPGSLLRLQVVNCIVYCLAAAAVWVIPVDFTSDELLLISGCASLFSAIPFIVRDIIDRSSISLAVSDEFRLIYISDKWTHLGALCAYQAVNACGTAVDTLLTGLGGLQTAADYQLIKRPMLALGSLNIALGQYSMNRYSLQGTAGWKRSLWFISPVMVIWPTFGVIGLVIVSWITPAGYQLSFEGGILLALSFAIGALLQVTGTIVLVQKRTGVLLFSSVVRVFFLVGIAVFSVPAMGVAGIAFALVLANGVLLALHLMFLAAGKRGGQITSILLGEEAGSADSVVS